MTAVDTAPEQTVQAVEYIHVSTVGAANGRAREGWTLHSLVPIGTEVWWVMQRPLDVEAQDLAADLDEARANWSRLATEVAGLRRDLAAAEAERDRLQQCAEMTPGELLQVRRAGSSEGGHQVGLGGGS